MIEVKEGYRAFNGHVFTAREAEAYMQACRTAQDILDRQCDCTLYQQALDHQNYLFKLYIGQINI